MALSQAPASLSFEVLYKTYRPHVLRWARPGGIPARDREDLAQKVFTQLHLALAEGRFDGGCPGRWLCIVTFRLIRDQLERSAERRVCLRECEDLDITDERARIPEEV